jgi:hypothetical protein
MTDETMQEKAPLMSSPLDLLSEMQRRLSAVEASQADIHRKIDEATKAGTLDPALLKKTAHVMTKFFPHDEPETEAPPAPRAMFDAFTGHPLN